MAYQRYDNPQLQNDYGIDTAALSRLYQHPSDYLWLKQQKLTTEAHEALEFIAGSVNHGLDPNDYHQDLLQQIHPASNKAESHLFDLMLSDGLLKLIRDISTGRLDPTIVDPEWTIPRTSFNAVTFLQAALSENQLKARLNSLVPESDDYRHLKVAIKRYQIYVDRGGWPNIPATPMLKPGDSHKNIPVIRHRLTIEGYPTIVEATLLRDIYDDNLVRAVKKFQRHHGIVVDGMIGPVTLQTMNVTASARLKQINIALERLRWMPDDLGRRYILVNLANFRLTAIEDDKVKLDMRVIIGKTKRPTPSFSSKITDIVQNPRWYVPNKLARQDLLPKQQNNPNYFSRANIRVFGTVDGKRTELDPHSIDWRSVSEQYFPYSLVQDPGEKNALGDLKFIMPNPWKIYLHDTPSKSLFYQNARNFSSGCIRVEDPYALANFSLGGTKKIKPLVESSNVGYRTTLEEPLSVYLIYATVWYDGNEIIFSTDNYQRDQQMAKYL
jgi:L,D-transpeptidase YcbB